MFPKCIQIETTTVCPAGCIMCPHKFVSRPKFMVLSLIEKIIDECAGKDVTIIPHQMGDALADHRIMDILRKCKAAKLKILISTSGILLDKNKSREMIDIGVDTINVSLDSLSKRTYEKIRRLPFDKVMKNVKDLLAVRKPATKVWISAVDMFFNKKSREAFLNHWKGLVDHVQIAPYVQYPKVKHWRLPRKKAKDSNRCERMENDIVILSDGKVSKCCIDFDGSTIFGDVNAEKISEIWNGRKRKDFIDRMRAEGRKKLYPCNICVI